jgi:hypothetical protein
LVQPQVSTAVVRHSRNNSDNIQKRFVDIDVEQTEAPFAENVPPLLVSQPLPVQGLVFVTTPDDLRDTEPHPAPRSQFVIVLDGEFEIETTDGARRIFPRAASRSSRTLPDVAT